MPEDDHTDSQRPTFGPSGGVPSSAPPEPNNPGTLPDGAPPRAEADPLDQTVGTGSVFAIGCVALTVLILALGVGYAIVTRLL